MMTGYDIISCQLSRRRFLTYTNMARKKQLNIQRKHKAGGDDKSGVSKEREKEQPKAVEQLFAICLVTFSENFMEHRRAKRVNSNSVFICQQLHNLHLAVFKFSTEFTVLRLFSKSLRASEIQKKRSA